jgi:hypothetical protein
MTANNATTKPLNEEIEIHDSVLGSVEIVDRKVTLNFTPAYIHKSHGEPGGDPRSGWTQDVTVVIENGVADSNLPSLPCDLTDGSLTIGDQVWRNSIPLPLRSEGSVKLELIAMWGGEISASGNRITAILLGRSKYVEESPGNSR